jgi:outer membrane receptor protein involved in Fe transport
MNLQRGLLKLGMVVLAATALGGLVGASAQDLALAGRGPRFLFADNPEATPRAIDVRAVRVLRDRIALDLDGATLADALGAITRQTGLKFVYSADVVPADSRVHLRAQEITVAAALTEILLDTGVDVLLSPGAQAALVKRPEGAQGGTVLGRVTDAKTAKAIPNVSVVLEGTRWRATTGEDGEYRLLDVTAGTYPLTASRIGYGKQSQSVTVAVGQEVTVDIKLQAAATELEQVVVTGTVTPTERKAVPTPISVITGDQIEQKGYQRVDQIFRGDVAGAFAWDNGASSQYYSNINVRGASSISNSYIKTYIDGVEVSNPLYLTAIDPSTVERIEVLRGPQGSTIYGSDASGGVMQIFTKKGSFGSTQPTIEAKVSAGLIQSNYASGATVQQDHSLTVTGGGQAFSYRLGAGYLHYGDWAPELFSDNVSLSGGLRETQGPLTVEVSARYYDKTYGTPLDPRLRDAGYAPFSKPLNLTNDIRQQTFGINLLYKTTPRWRHTVVLGFDRWSLESSNPPRFTTPADSFAHIYHADAPKASLAYNTTVDFPLGEAVQSSVSVGADHYTYNLGSFYGDPRNNTGTFNASDLTAGRLKYSNTGYFAQGQLGLRDALFVTVGLRAEDNQNFGKDFGLSWAPRVGVSYVRDFAGITAKARVAYGKAIRPPPPGAADAATTPYATLLANPNLGPEQQVGPDGGLELYFGTRGSVEATYYHQTARDLIDNVLVNANATPPQYEYQNVGRIRNTGWEFQGRLNLGVFSLTGTYSIMNSVVETLAPGYSGDLRPGDQLLAIPKHTAGATLSYHLQRTTVALGVTSAGSWTNYDLLALDGFFYGGQPYRGSLRAYWTEYPGFTKLNLSLSHEFSGRLGIFLRSENLTDDHAYEVDNSTITAGRITMFGVRTKL